MAEAAVPIKRRRFRKPVFDPEGAEYDYISALRYNLAPDKHGHWPSREPKTGLILKGRKHPTWNLTEKGESEAGFRILKKGGRYYSEPEESEALPWSYKRTKAYGYAKALLDYYQDFLDRMEKIGD